MPADLRIFVVVRHIDERQEAIGLHTIHRDRKDTTLRQYHVPGEFSKLKFLKLWYLLAELIV